MPTFADVAEMVTAVRTGNCKAGRRFKEQALTCIRDCVFPVQVSMPVNAVAINNMDCCQKLLAQGGDPSCYSTTNSSHK